MLNNSLNWLYTWSSGAMIWNRSFFPSSNLIERCKLRSSPSQLTTIYETEGGNQLAAYIIYHVTKSRWIDWYRSFVDYKVSSLPWTMSEPVNTDLIRLASSLMFRLLRVRLCSIFTERYLIYIYSWYYSSSELLNWIKKNYSNRLW